MHLRGKEGETLHRFADDHYQHRLDTDVLDDYIQEPPEDFEDVFNKYHEN